MSSTIWQYPLKLNMCISHNLEIQFLDFYCRKKPTCSCKKMCPGALFAKRGKIGMSPHIYADGWLSELGAIYPLETYGRLGRVR